VARCRRREGRRRRVRRERRCSCRRCRRSRTPRSSSRATRASSDVLRAGGRAGGACGDVQGGQLAQAAVQPSPIDPLRGARIRLLSSRVYAARRVDALFKLFATVFGVDRLACALQDATTRQRGGVEESRSCRALRPHVSPRGALDMDKGACRTQSVWAGHEMISEPEI
jgi:hypothetical protein